MAVTKKGRTIVMSAATDTIPGVVRVNKITAVVGGAGSTDIKLRVGGSTGNIIFDASAATAFVNDSTPSLLTFSVPQDLKNLYIETLANATIVVFVV